MDDKAIIARINAQLRNSGMTQDEAALKLGLSRNAFGNILRGKTKNFYKHLPAIAELFGVSEESLVSPEGESLSALLKEADKWEEQRQELVRFYEDKIAELQKTIEEKDSLLAAFKQVCSMQGRLLEQND